LLYNSPTVSCGKVSSSEGGISSLDTSYAYTSSTSSAESIIGSCSFSCLVSSSVVTSN